MKTITIPNDAAKVLVQQLELEKWRRTHDLEKWKRSLDGHPAITVDEMHRWFHYHVVRWLQEHGADLL